MGQTFLSRLSSLSGGGFLPEARDYRFFKIYTPKSSNTSDNSFFSYDSLPSILIFDFYAFDVVNKAASVNGQSGCGRGIVIVVPESMSLNTETTFPFLIEQGSNSVDVRLAHMTFILCVTHQNGYNQFKMYYNPEFTCYMYGIALWF